MVEPTQEMVDFFENRTNEHICRVKRNMLLMRDYKGLSENALKKRGECHDASKFNLPERKPYIYLSWWHKCKNEGIDYNYPANVETEVNAAIEHHKKINLHHPESHKDVNDMELLDIVEMVCDWTAMAQEYRNKSCYSYAIENINNWSFSNDKINEIFFVIAELDKRLSEIESN